LSLPDALASPTNLEAAFRSARAASALVIFARLSSSISIILFEILSIPRRFNAASKFLDYRELF